MDIEALEDMDLEDENIPPLEVFAGPCVLESEQMVMGMAEGLAHVNEQCSPLIQITFKGSFDKANRTSMGSYRGPGMEKGLRLLEKVKNTFDLPVVTDFHLPSQANDVACVVDTLQVPAFLCRQTDMIVEGAKACKKYGRRLKIKKGQFMAPEQTKYIVQKAHRFMPKKNILLTERGSCFGYSRLVVDMTSFSIMKSFGVKTVHDVTHSVQRPGGKTTGGCPEQAIPLALAAITAGADAIFLETHPDPPNALSDKDSQLPLVDFPSIVSQFIFMYRVAVLVRETEK